MRTNRSRQFPASFTTVAKQVTTAVAVCVVSAALQPLAVAADPPGRVNSVRNTAVVLRSGTSIDATPGLALSLEDIVRTGEKARAKLSFSDDSILNLGEKSQVKVAEYLYNPEKQRSKSVYQLLDGVVKVVVGRSDLEIHTTTAVAAARGTVYYVWEQYIGDRIQSNIVVISGVVSARNIDGGITGDVRIGPGSMSSIVSGRPPGRPLPVPPDLMRDVRNSVAKKLTADQEAALTAALATGGSYATVITNAVDQGADAEAVVFFLCTDVVNNFRVVTDIIYSAITDGINAGDVIAGALDAGADLSVVIRAATFARADRTLIAYTARENGYTAWQVSNAFAVIIRSWTAGGGTAGGETVGGGISGGWTIGGGTFGGGIISGGGGGTTPGSPYQP